MEMNFTYQLHQPDAFFVMKIANASLTKFSRQALRARNHRLSKSYADPLEGEYT